MTWSRDDQIAVRDLLARLYPSANIARRVLWDAGLETAGYTFGDNPTTMWTGIVTQLVDNDDLDAVYAVARKEYPKNAGVRAIEQRRAPPEATPVGVPGAPPLAAGALESAQPTPASWRLSAAGSVDFRRLTGSQWAALQRALMEAFPNYQDLAMLVRHHLGQNLNAIAGSQNVSTATYELIQWSQARGWTERLFLAARAAQPDNPSLAEFGLAVTTPGTSAPARAIADTSLERIIRQGLPTFKLVELMAQLGVAQVRVCRVEVDGAAAGTGFLVGPSAVMTNYHVIEPILRDRVDPTRVMLRFDWHPGVEGSVVALDPDWCIAKSPPEDFERVGGSGGTPDIEHLDYALLRTAIAVGNKPVVDVPVAPGQTARLRGWFALPQARPAVGEETPLYIVQHPKGRPMEIAMEMVGGARFNTGRTRMSHAVNTEPGSSGSPVFTFDGRLVALHHAGSSSVLASRNEAIPLEVIRDRLDAAGVLAELPPFVAL